MIQTSPLAQPSLRSRLARTVARGAVAVGLATMLLTISAGSTLAYGDNGPNATLAGYGVTVGASVACDATNSTMTVSASATTMQVSGFFGPTAGPYDAGQYLRYNIWARELGASAWNQVYSWSDWQWIQSKRGDGDVSIISPVDLGTSVVNGTAGHSYDILVQIDYWTGAENVINVTPNYSQNLNLSGIGLYLEPGYCHL